MTTATSTRFLASLTGNLLRSGISFATALLLARWFGPQDYGRMAFLLASFVAFRQILDIGSSTAFFTLLSQRRRSRRFISVFWSWVGLQLLISMSAVYLILPDSVIAWIWVGESRLTLLLALACSFMQGTVWTIAAQMAEASRETVRVQKLNTAVVIFHLAVILTLWHFQQLAIPLIFAALAIEWACAGYIAAKLYRTQEEPQEIEEGGKETVKSIGREFLIYCLPLIPYTWVGFVHDFADRWMLQHWGGSTEQAYFSVAQQFAIVPLLATSSILSIFWKEIAEAHHNGDSKRVEYLYRKVSRVLFFIGAAMAGGVLPWAREILHLSAGEAYAEGVATLMLMLLYPVHQSIGQIGGAMLYATGHVRTQVTLGITFMTISSVVAYFMMAPANAPLPGLGLASQGLGGKMVLLQIVQVNIVAWFIARLFGWRFDWLYQLVGLLGCLGLGYAAFLMAKFVSGGSILSIVEMGLAGIFYLGMVTLLIFSMPWLTGLSRTELTDHVRRLAKAKLY